MSGRRGAQSQSKRVTISSPIGDGINEADTIGVRVEFHPHSIPCGKGNGRFGPGVLQISSGSRNGQFTPNISKKCQSQG